MASTTKVPSRLTGSFSTAKASGSGTDGTSPARSATDGLRALASLPATIALVLGAIYATGAIAHASALSHIGVSAKAVFTDIPLEQHLDKGIEVLVRPSIIAALVIMLLAVVTIESFVNLQIKRQRSKTSQGRINIPTRLVMWCLAIGFIVLVYFAPVAAGALLIAVLAQTLSVGVLLLVDPESWRSIRRPPPGTLRLAAIISILVLGIYSGYVTPESLPRVLLRLESGQSVSGRLIAYGDGTWYLANAQHAVEALDSRRVLSAKIHAMPPYRLASDETLMDILRK